MLYRFENLEKSYGPHDVLKGVSWQHNPGEHVGLVGRNGAGKTTLFRLLLKQEEPDRGQVIRASGMTIGHVGQHLNAEPGMTLFDFVETAFAEVLRIERKMRAIEQDLADTTKSAAAHEKLLEKYAELQHDFEHADGYTLHAEVDRVLTGLGFDKGEFERPIAEFSGGQQNRAMLARVLLTKVDLLLLDEPTNHLDLKGIEFLEEFLQSFTGSYLLISHDRTFLNRTVAKIVELAHGKLIEYHGNYEKFLEQRAERMEKMAVDYERQQELIEKTQDFIRRNIAGQKTKQAKSRRKMLDKMEELERPETDETLAAFNLDAGPRSGAVALTADRLTAGYGEKPIVHNFSLTIRRGERYAIMGPNGSGKSTLLKTFASRLAPLAGAVSYGHNVQVGYYDQTLGDLNPNGIVIDEVWNLDHSQTEEEVRSYLARFSFFGDDVFKKTRDLSGGEKGRLALAKIMYTGGNVMLLDEPTNHLDVYTREALEEALERFTGALVVVSHDRYFIDRVAQNVIVVEEGVGEVYSGNYSDLVERFKAGTATPISGGGGGPPAPPPPPPPRPPPPPQAALGPPPSTAARRPRGAAQAREAHQEDRRGDRPARRAHRRRGAGARAQRPPPLLAGSLPRRRTGQEDPAAEPRSEIDDRPAVRQVGGAGEGERGAGERGRLRSRAMQAAIIAIGSEMLGPVRLDTNSLKVTAALELCGVPLVRKAVVGDTLDDIANEIRFSLAQADVLIITGGLGPTEDDLTREALAKAFGLEMEVDQSIIDKLEARFAARGWVMPETNKRQANVFRGQTTLNNERGTAPGFHLRVEGKDVWVFPGVPHELEWMTATYFQPWLEQVCGGASRYRRVLKIAGITESGVDEKLKPYYDAHRDEPTLTVLASPGGIELHLIGDGGGDVARAWVDGREQELRAIFGDRIFGRDDDTLESVVGELLVARGATLSVAESCTGGLMQSRITDVAGASRYFMGGAIVYTGDAKVALAGVDRALIQAHGEVSEEVAIALARGIRERFGTTYGVGITGIAGPTGGSEAKPVGTVHIAVAGPEAHEHRKLFWQGTRPIIKWFSSQAALDLLRRFLLRHAS